MKLATAIAACNTAHFHHHGYRVSLEHCGPSRSTDDLVATLTDGGAPDQWGERFVTDASPSDFTAQIEREMIVPRATGVVSAFVRAAAAHFNDADYEGLVFFAGSACGAQHWVLVGRRANGQVDALVVRALL